MKLIPCLYIFTVLNGKKKYIVSTETRFDQTQLPVLNEDIGKAMPFCTEQEVKEFVAKFHNPYNRVFENEPGTCKKNDVAPIPLSGFSEAARSALIT